MTERVNSNSIPPILQAQGKLICRGRITHYDHCTSNLPLFRRKEIGLGYPVGQAILSLSCIMIDHSSEN